MEIMVYNLKTDELETMDLIHQDITPAEIANNLYNVLNNEYEFRLLETMEMYLDHTWIWNHELELRNDATLYNTSIEKIVSDYDFIYNYTF